MAKETKDIKGKVHESAGGAASQADKISAARMTATPPDTKDFTITGIMTAFVSVKDIANGAVGAGGTAAGTKGSAFNRHPLAHKVQLIASRDTSSRLKNGSVEGDDIDVGVVGASFVWDAMELDDVLVKTNQALATRIQVVLG